MFNVGLLLFEVNFLFFPIIKRVPKAEEPKRKEGKSISPLQFGAQCGAPHWLDIAHLGTAAARRSWDF